MSSQKNRRVILGFVVSVSLISSAFAVFLTSCWWSRSQFGLLSAVCGEILEREPEAEGAVLAALKECAGGTNPLEDGTCLVDGGQLVDGTGLTDGAALTDKAGLTKFGYRSRDFSAPAAGPCAVFSAAGFLAGTLPFFFSFLYRDRAERGRIRALTGCLERANEGKAVMISSFGEDEFSKLEDEICKTVTSLRHMKDQAVEVRNGFAENLSNIAHQLKTPVAAISLDVQMLENDFDRSYLDQIRKQLSRLSYLEKALLTLSRLDAGALIFRKNETDVLTVLALAADSLQELCAAGGTGIEIPDTGGAVIAADPDWTAEAVMNLMKNCMEHSEGGVVRCAFSQNPLYTEILIWDEGEGFAKEDIPHLFERFYRGKNAAPGGIGIGLALAKEIIERQNGTLRAENRREGGACFEIRFYCH